jgi:hypothetical protein
MNDASAQTAATGEAFEALRERWRHAKANGTTEAFARELWERGQSVPPPGGQVYASDAERTAYEWARAFCPPKPSDLLAVLPLYFGDEQGISPDGLIDSLDALASRNGPAGEKDDAAN